MAVMGRYDSYGAQLLLWSASAHGLSALAMSHFDVGSQALAGNERWFLAHTLPKSEWKAELHLGAQGFRTYLPQIRKTIRHARQLRTVRAPLFPRYLFVTLDLERDRWLSVRSTVGVSSLFTTQDGRPVPVPVGIVESLIEQCRRQRDALGYRSRQRAARSHPVRPFCRFRRNARAAGRGRTGTGFARNDGNRGSCYTSPFGACAGGIKTAPRLTARCSAGGELG